MSQLQVVSDNAAQNLMRYSPEQVDLIKRTICKGASDDELQMFMYQCNKVGLDPFMRQIWSIERKAKNGDKWETQRTCQVSIDGLRLIAERTGKYQGQTSPEWCGEDGKWVNVWVKNNPPIAARVGVYRDGFKEPLYGIARLSSYAQKTKDGNFTKFWATMPDLMLSKCAESLALRKAFPLELSGLYTQEEMGQEENVTDVKNPSLNKSKLIEPKDNKSEEKILQYEINMAAAKTMEELAKNFLEARNYAHSVGVLERYKDRLVQVKEKRKSELEINSVIPLEEIQENPNSPWNHLR